jgi:hypothetical protein
MTHKQLFWGLLAVVGIIVVLLLTPAVTPRPKARAQAGRIANVNRVHSVSMVITNTNMPANPDQ